MMPHWLIVCLWPLFWGGGALGCVALAICAFRARRRLWRAPGIIATALAPLMMGATFGGLPIAPTNAVMRLYPSWQYFAVLRLGVNTIGDAPPQWFVPTSTACTISGGDVGSEVPTADGGCENGIVQLPGNVREWGAKLDGSTDDSAAVNACLVAETACVIPTSTAGLYAANGVTVPGGEMLVGIGPAGDVNAPAGSFVLCKNIAFDCVTMTGTGAAIRNLGIFGVSGTPVSGAIGLYFNNVVNATVENVWSVNHDTCIAFFGSSPPPPGGGIRITIINPEVSKCATHYWSFDGYPAVQVTGGRTGSYAGNDYSSATDFIYAQNTTCTTGGCGPNGIYFTNHVFNAGGLAGPACFLSFANFTASGSSDEDWKFIGSHVETVSGAVICSDSTVSVVAKIDFIADDFLNTSFNLFNINAATSVANVDIYGGCFGGNVNLSPSSTTWESIVVDGGGGQCPIGVSIAPSGSGSVHNININNTEISSFTYAPSSTTRSYGTTITNSTFVSGAVSATWASDSVFSTLAMIGDHFFSAPTFNGGTGDGELALSGDIFSATLTLSGQWFALNAAGNIINGTLTNTATGNALIVDAQKGLVASGGGTATKYVCVDTNNKIVTQSAAC